MSPVTVDEKQVLRAAVRSPLNSLGHSVSEKQTKEIILNTSFETCEAHM